MRRLCEERDMARWDHGRGLFSDLRVCLAGEALGHGREEMRLMIEYQEPHR